MKLYAKQKDSGQIVEVVFYQNTKGRVGIICPMEGRMNVSKSDIEFIGFKNGKGATGNLQCPNEEDRKDIEHYQSKGWLR